MNPLSLTINRQPVTAAPGTTILEAATSAGIDIPTLCFHRSLEKRGSCWMRVYLGAFAVVLAPVAEEFIFRGMLYPLVKQLGSPRYAFFGISAIFALIHLDAGTLVPLFVLALALTWLYEKTDNLLAPIVAHSLFNGANLVVLCLAEEFSRQLPAPP